VRDLIKGYRNALRRANARIVELETRALEAESNAAIAAARAALPPPVVLPPPAAAPPPVAAAPPVAPPPPAAAAAPRAAAPPPPPPSAARAAARAVASEDGVAAVLRDEVSSLDAEIAALRRALKAEGAAADPKPLEVRAREAARAILASSGRSSRETKR
jgi:hypothetical protein